LPSIGSTCTAASDCAAAPLAPFE